MNVVGRVLSLRRLYSTKVVRTDHNKFSDKLHQKLIETIGPGNVTVQHGVREHHGSDESYHKLSVPDAVVYPVNVEQVSAVLRLCNEARTVLVPWGTGTGLEGGATPNRNGVVMDLTKMDGVVELNDQDFDVTVEPGVTRVGLNNYIKETGLWFPIDPGADCSVCGMCATSASGTNAVRYGTMRENVINLEVVLANGTVIDTRGRGKRSRKTSAGYNLTNLFVGSEGTLGVITKATVRLHPLPEASIAAVCPFPDIESCVNAATMVMQSAIPVAKIELLDDVMIDAMNKHSKLDHELLPHLFFEFHGSQSAVQEHQERTREIAEMFDVVGFRYARATEERNALWKARHDCLYAAKALRPGMKGKMTDVCVPLSKLADTLIKTKEEIAAKCLIGPIVGHVGDGNFHVTLIYDMDDPAEERKANEVHDNMCRLAIRNGGTCTGEHGIGIGKRHLLEEEVGDGALQVMWQLKQTLDPNDILNPGTIFYN